jgi:hypothetical protein
MTSAPPTRAVANLHLHLEYDSGLDVLAAAMAAVPGDGESSDAHRAHVSGDISAAVAHLLDVEALTPEGCPVRVTDVAVEVTVDIDGHDHAHGALDVPSRDDDDELTAEAEELFEALGMPEDDFTVIAQADLVGASVGPPPFELRPDDLTGIPRFIADWGMACGYLARACSYVMDSLFDDLDTMHMSLRRGGSNGLTATVIADSLPQQWLSDYTPLFLRKFIVTMGDVTTRLAAGWDGPANLAQVLAMSYLLDSVEMVSALDDTTVRDDMMEVLRERLLDEDLLEALYEGHPSTEFPLWFVPFEHEAAIAPYARDNYR